MSAEEPAWKAALSADVECAIGLNQDCGGAEGVRVLRDHVLEDLEFHIQAAEQRGREAALREAAEKIRGHFPDNKSEAVWQRHIVYGLAGQSFEATDALDALLQALAKEYADLTDPDKP